MDDGLSPDAAAARTDEQLALPGTTEAPPSQGPTPKRNRRSRSTSGGAAPAAPKRGRPDNHDTRAKRVTAVYEQLGGFAQLALAIPTGRAELDPRAVRVAQLGYAVVDNAAPIGEAWATWADTSPRVAQLIDSLSFGGGALGVMLAHGPIIMAIVHPAPLDPEAVAFAASLRGTMAPEAAPSDERSTG